MAALIELASYLTQTPVQVLGSFFYCLTMQETFESISREDLEHNALMNDWTLFKTLFARIMDYMQIENHTIHKVTFGAFPEENFTFIQKVMGNLAERCFCVASSGNVFGLVPKRSQLGDSLAIVKGVPVPFVPREASESAAEDGTVYNPIGNAYILGTMRGELTHEDILAWSEILLISLVQGFGIMKFVESVVDANLRHSACDVTNHTQHPISHASDSSKQHSGDDAPRTLPVQYPATTTPSRWLMRGDRLQDYRNGYTALLS